MNYGELKTNLKALAFEEDETIDEYVENDVIPTAINRAISTIGNRLMPIVKTFEITQDGTDTEYQRYDFTKLTKDFLDFRKHPVEIGDGEIYKPFGDYQIEDDEILILKGSTEGTFRVFYTAEHTPYVPGGDMEDTQIPLKRKVHYMVPLLAAYYVWLDDDATKAAQYYNMYETEESYFLARQKNPRVRFLEGGL